MIIGVPKEIKDNEYRVAMTPSGVQTLTSSGHTVLIEKGAGIGSSFTDEQYVAAGATIIASAKELFASSELIVKVKEPMASEHKYLRAELTLFTFLHLAANKELAAALAAGKTTAIAYETVGEHDGSMPILRPMSEVAGKLAVQIGADCLLKTRGGRGVLLGGVTNVERGKVVIIGAGTVGVNALQVAFGLGASVTIIDLSKDNLAEIDEVFGGMVETRESTPENIEEAILDCDLLIGAVHIAGARTPVLVPETLVKKMKKGSVILDIAVDQGGCVETIRPTTHSEPTYEVHGVVHYGVSNMPGAVPRTSTLALTNITLPFIQKLADGGIRKTLKTDPSLKSGLNIMEGKVCHKAVAEATGLPFTPPGELL
ncbi:Alanine dehydrogenase [hydrothermal vent metagenome]|uniref:alanine dehydrogenase n=1 Tax=hydrothermal vent metagenome TaxID=652676 RepID=A0A3B0RAR0_9ZZZZ